jgi:aldose 1-epimerase
MFDLVAGDAKLTLVPRLGGSIGNWERRGTPILRHTGAEALAGPTCRTLSCFPLIPFSNRIAQGRFSFGGEDFQLDRNFGDEPHAIHGNAWQREWTVFGQSASQAELRLDHDPATAAGHHWPYAYQAALIYALGPNSLHVTIRITNMDTRAQPVGLGLHPYQPRTPQTAIAFRAGTVWSTTADSLPDKQMPVEGTWSFDPGHVITPPPLDNCYAAWTGRAEITRPEHGIRLVIAADDIFRHLVVFTPEEFPFFAVEPASNMRDAVNRMDKVPAHGLRILASVETLERQIRFLVEDL